MVMWYMYSWWSQHVWLHPKNFPKKCSLKLLSDGHLSLKTQNLDSLSTDGRIPCQVGRVLRLVNQQKKGQKKKCGKRNLVFRRLLWFNLSLLSQWGCSWNMVSALAVKWDAQKGNDSKAMSLHYDKNKLTPSEGTNKVKFRVYKHIELSWRKLWIVVWVLTISLSCCTMVGTLFPCHTHL